MCVLYYSINKDFGPKKGGELKGKKRLLWRVALIAILLKAPVNDLMHVVDMEPHPRATAVYE
jgi:hypothetical protein